jgi:hypothetical protein
MNDAEFAIPAADPQATPTWRQVLLAPKLMSGLT